MLLEPIGLRHIGDGVLERVAGEENSGTRQQHHRAVMAMDVGMAQFDRGAADLQRELAIESSVRHDERLDRGITAALFEFPPMLGKRLRGEAVGDDLAILEDLVPRHMIRVPMAQHDAKIRDAGGAQASRG